MIAPEYLSAPHVRPTGTQVVIIPIRDEAKLEQTASGIYLDTRMSPGGVALPDEVDNEPCEGRVVALGDGWTAGCPTCEPNGKQRQFEVKVGDRVLWCPWFATTITLEGTEFNLVTEDAILGIVEESPALTA